MASNPTNPSSIRTGGGGGSANSSTTNSPILPTKSLSDDILLPSKSSKQSVSSHRSNTSISSNSSNKEHSSHTFTSLFHRHSEQSNEHSALSQMLAPALSVAGAHNPFSISALNEDGTRKRTHVYGKSDKNKEDENAVDHEDIHEDAESVHRRRRRRDRFRSAFGRSLSPWRYHNESGEKDRRRGGGGWSLSHRSRDSLDVQREQSEKQSGETTETETESEAESVKSGIVPRNNAFANFTEDSESEEEMGNTSNRIKSRAMEERQNQRESEDRVKEEVKENEETDGEDSDDYIDFDEETLDNTLYNAGCIDLHDDWVKDEHGMMVKETRAVHHSGGTCGEAQYGPDDYDAAWSGAGPTGHNEGDEGLRAPNVVIGQEESLSPSALAGEGMEILTIDDTPVKPHAGFTKNLSPSSRSRSESSTTINSGKQSISSTNTGIGNKTSDSNDVRPDQRLTASRPIFEKNRCTITLIHGEYEKYAKESKRPRRYIAASDGSEESSYAIEWTIGTVLRDGDEMLIVSVMETDTKLDANDHKHEDKLAHQEHQKIRQSMAVILARRAVAVLQRTRLAVRVSCQALHARNSRHMFIDMIDFFEPTMCVVGSRGLGSLKGVLLGSFSHYCVQKSPVPVMVARKRLKLPPLPKGKTDVVSNVRARHMRLDEAMIEKDANVAEETPEKKEADKEKKENEEDEKVEGQDEQKHADADGVSGDASEGSTTTVPGLQQNLSEKELGSDEKKSDDKPIDEEEKHLSPDIEDDAVQASELIQKSENSDQSSKDAPLSSTSRSTDTVQSRGRKKFTVGNGDDADDEEETRGRSRSRSRH